MVEEKEEDAEDALVEGGNIEEIDVPLDSDIELDDYMEDIDEELEDEE